MVYKITIKGYYIDEKIFDAPLEVTVHTDAVPRLGEFINYDGDNFQVEKVTWEMGENKATTVRIIAHERRWAPGLIGG